VLQSLSERYRSLNHRVFAGILGLMSRLRIAALRVEHVGPVDLTIEAGQCVVLSGASGTGKSLLLRAIADVLPHQGDCWLDDVKASTVAPAAWRKRVGLLPAESQWWYETVGEHFTGFDESTLRDLGFKPKVMGWSVARCSTGEKQRLALLRLLANKPQVLLLDEPTASLDRDNTRGVETIVGQYRRDHQAPVIWVTHDSEQTQRVANSVYELGAGRLKEIRR
jgi:ABC-type iron transport system FetAB ATPase subunit